MSSLAALKALAVVSALGIGAGAVALVVTVQRNPFAFTTGEPQAAGANLAPAALEIRPIAPPVEVEPVVPDALANEPAPAPAKPAPAATHRQRPAPRATRSSQTRALPTPQPVADQEPVDRVIPAPCINGQYRKLEEHRGVRLMCPGQH